MTEPLKQVFLHSVDIGDILCYHMFMRISRCV